MTLNEYADLPFSVRKQTIRVTYRWLNYPWRMIVNNGEFYGVCPRCGVNDGLEWNRCNGEDNRVKCKTCGWLDSYRKLVLVPVPTWARAGLWTERIVARGLQQLRNTTKGVRRLWRKK